MVPDANAWPSSLNFFVERLEMGSMHDEKKPGTDFDR
jgi:hypothetical protein